MALLFCDGFASYAATADLTKKWALAQSPWAWSSTGGPDGGPCAVGTAASTAELRSQATVLGGVTRVCIGYFLKISALSAGQYHLRMYDTIGTSYIQMRTSTAGAIEAINNGGGTIMAGTKFVCDNQWHWVEVEVNTVVSQPMKIYVDNALDFSGFLTTTAGALVHKFSFLTSASYTTSIANVVVWDNNAPGIVAANFPLGARNITTLRPNGDGALQFTRSSGSSSFALIDEVNGDTSDYVETSTNGNQDLYDYAALGFNPVGINSVMVNSYLHNPSTGVINSQGVCKSGSTTSAGASLITPPLTARVVQTPFDLDPNGSIPWTQTNLDAAQFGIKAVTV